MEETFQMTKVASNVNPSIWHKISDTIKGQEYPISHFHFKLQLYSNRIMNSFEYFKASCPKLAALNDFKQ